MTPDEHIDAQPEPRRSDLRQLHELIRDAVPNLDAEPSGGAIGYGRYRYRYASGRQGDWFAIILAPNKGSISVHVNAVVDGRYLVEERADRFPKAHVGKSCVRFRHPRDVDPGALRELVRDGAAIMMAGTQSSLERG